MGGAHSRRKGAAFEREIAARLTQLLGTEVKRRLGQARDSGHDLQLAAGPYIIECKRRAGIAVVRWFEQAKVSTTGAGEIPMVVMREDGGQPLVLLSLDDLFGRFALAVEEAA